MHRGKQSIPHSGHLGMQPLPGPSVEGICGINGPEVSPGSSDPSIPPALRLMPSGENVRLAGTSAPRFITFLLL